MNCLIFIFKKSNSYYLVIGETLEDAWLQLSQRQSMSLINCKKQYMLITVMNEYSDIVKLKN